MSCRCHLCQLLGGVEDEERSKTSSTRHEIESHNEIHRHQLKFIEDASGDSIIIIGSNDQSATIVGKPEEQKQSAMNDGKSENRNGEEGGRKLETKQNESKSMDRNKEATTDHNGKADTLRKSPSTPKTDEPLVVVENKEPNVDQQRTNSARESIRAHCRSVLQKRRRFTDTRAYCKLCKTEKSVYWNTGIVSYDIVLRHILSHLGRSIYSCRHCELSSNYVQEHLKSVHHIEPKNSSGHFDDNISNYVDEIKALITICFGKQEDNSKKVTAGESSKTTSSRASSVSANLATSASSSNGRRGRKTVGQKRGNRPADTDELAKIRQELCWRLIRNAGNPDKMRCQKCGDDVRIAFNSNRSVGPLSLRNHIQTIKHLPKPMYTCRLCHAVISKYRTMHCHFKKKHRGVSMTNNYVNRENDYHDETMRELLACFGKDDSTDDGVKTDGQGSSSRNETVSKVVGKGLKRKNVDQAEEQRKRGRLDDPSAQSVVMDETNSKSNQDTNQDRVVSGRQMHRCPVCERSFGYQLVLKKHMEVFHSG